VRELHVITGLAPTTANFSTGAILPLQYPLGPLAANAWLSILHAQRLLEIFQNYDIKPSPMRIYTRTGDQGSTSLFGNTRVAKCDLRIAAYGTVDELNAVLGVARADGLPQQCELVVLRLQNQLFDLGAELATPKPEERGTDILQSEDIAEQEAVIDELEQALAPLAAFVLPGGTKGAAGLHLARCVCRRAEREIVALSQIAQIREVVLEFINRTSDLLFVLARTANAAAGTGDLPWTKSR